MRNPCCVRSIIAAGALALAISNLAWGQRARVAVNSDRAIYQIQRSESWSRPNKTADTFDSFIAQQAKPERIADDGSPCESALDLADIVLANAEAVPLSRRVELTTALFYCGDGANAMHENEKAERYFIKLLAIVSAPSSSQDEELWRRRVEYEALYKALFVRVNSGRSVDKDLVRRLAKAETSILRWSLIDSFVGWDELYKDELPNVLADGRHPPLDAYQNEWLILQDALTIIVSNLLGSSSDMETLANAVIQRKAVIQEVLTKLRAIASKHDDHVPTVPSAPNANRPASGASVFERLQANAAARSLLAYANPNFSPTALPRPTELYRERMALEKSLLHDPSVSVDGPSLVDIERKIPVGTLVVEFVTYLPRYRTAPTVDARRHYLVVALSAKGIVDVADIGPIDEINALIARACWSLAYDIAPEIAATRCFGDGSAASGEPPDPKAIGAKLYGVLLTPIASVIDQYKALIISPDEALNLLPFEILTDSHGQFLLTTHLISYVQSARELAQWSAAAVSRGPAVAIGDPDYDAWPNEPEQVPCPTESEIGKSGRVVLSRTPWVFGPEMGSYLIFARLCGSAKEASEVKKAFPDARVLIGRSATEEAVKGLRGPRILHFATHAFVLKHLIWPSASVPSDRPYWKPEDFAVLSLDTMLPSGLALAGANIRHSPELHDDGLLSAEEASLLNLGGTQLVVLSACDSGFGIPAPGEGVFGLRKAFAMAGARAQTFALWSVPNTATINFMAMYYALLASGLDNNLALAKVKLKLMKEGVDPGVWANFVGYGYPGPLGP